jgi:hypothetical protein
VRLPRVRFYGQKHLLSPFYRYALTMLKDDSIADTFILHHALYHS